MQNLLIIINERNEWETEKQITGGGSGEEDGSKSYTLNYIKCKNYIIFKEIYLSY